MMNLSQYSLVQTDGQDDEDNSSEYSMDMVNDPRFVQPTVLDKRLYAFTSQVGFVGGLTSGASLSQCFKLKKHLEFGYCTPTPLFKVAQSLVQLISFFGMSTTLCLSLYSTLVSVNQSYFGNRLMTAGTNGFELARSFYMDRDLVQMRHRSVKFLARALILLLLSSGGMLYVKFAEDLDVEAGLETDDDQTRPIYSMYNRTVSMAHTSNWICSTHVHPAGVATIMLFTGMAYYLYRFIQLPHEQAFKNRYNMRYQQSDTFGGLLATVPYRGSWSAGTAQAASGTSPRHMMRFPGVEGRCLLM
jgi:hypothetical protein